MDDEDDPAPQMPAPAAQKSMAQSQGAVEIDIVGPLTFWIVILVVGAIIQFVLIPLTSSVPSVNPILVSIAGWILYLPGSIILPLVVAIWVGERVGASRNQVKSAVKVGLVNAVYAALIYAVAIFIIYLLLKYISPTFLGTITLTTFVEYVVAIPVAIVILLIPFIASLSAARHAGVA